MKQFIYALTFVALLSSCNTNKRVQDESLLSKPATVTPPTPSLNVNETITPVAPEPGSPAAMNPNVQGKMPVIEPISEEAKINPVITRSESVEVLDNEQNRSYNYFVIVGSYSSKENAERFSSSMKSKNFETNILKSNSTPYYRVSAGAFDNETEARNLIYRIRTDYTTYKDTWLLKSN